MQPTDLWSHFIKTQSLWDGWHRVRANQGGAGGDGVGPVAFDRIATKAIERLSTHLRDGHYRPGPYRHVSIPKKDGSTRTLSIPCIIDRVAQTALSIVLTPVMEAEFEPTSFAYRPGRGVAKAVQTILRHRRDGYHWTAEGDVARCFDDIPHELLLQRLDEVVGDDKITDLIGLWLGAYSPSGLGIPQGAPISPMLCNLHLDAVDDHIQGNGIRLVRYADDFVLLTKTSAKAERALENMAGHLAQLGLLLNPDKSKIVPADQALRFLGHVFVGSMAWKEVESDDDLPAPPDAPLEETLAAWARVGAAGGADMDDPAVEARPSGKRVLHLVEKGARLSTRNDSFAVLGPPILNEEGKPQRIGHFVEHARRIDRIEIGPGADADWSSLQLAAAWNVPVAMVSHHGDTNAWLSDYGDVVASRMLDQARFLADDERRNALATAIAHMRVFNQLQRLRRANLRVKNPDVTMAALAIRRIAKAFHTTLDRQVAMGHEGRAAAIYWPALSLLIDPSFGFGGQRVRRPPPDPINACLGFLYALLARDIRVAVQRAGLHPGLGALHSARGRNMALVYDLMEAFRAPICEATLMNLIGRGAIKANMFVILGPPDPEDRSVPHTCRMEEVARRALLTGYENRLREVITSRRTGLRIAWRALFEEEARALADVFAGHASVFEPYRMDQ